MDPARLGVVGCADLDVDRAEERAAAHDVPLAGEPETSSRGRASMSS